MLILLFFVVLLLLLVLSTLRHGASQLRRVNRQLRRIPCVACGCPLLPAARSCPHCGGRQPLRGWAGWCERMRQPAPGRVNQRAVILHVAPSAPPWWERQPGWTVFWIAVVVVVFAVWWSASAPQPVTASPAPPAPQHFTAPPGWDLQADGSYKIRRPSAPAKPPVASEAAKAKAGYDPCEPIKDAAQRALCRGHGPEPAPAKKPRTPMDDCLTWMDEMRLASGDIEWWPPWSFRQTIDDLHFCQANTGQ